MKSQNQVLKIVSYSFLISLLYACLRYNVLEKVPWTDLPIYVLNKAVALTIIILLFYNQINKNTLVESGSSLWFAIFVLAIFHILLSVVILSPEYYEKFYKNNQLSLIGSLSLLFGILAFIGFLIKGTMWIKNKLDKTTFLDSKHKTKIEYITLIFIASHIFVMGINGWLYPNKWPAYLLPISLIAFIFLVLLTIVLLYKKKI